MYKLPSLRSHLRFQGFISLLFGTLLFVVGIIGLSFAIKDSVSSPPRVESGIVIASAQESPSSNRYSVRVRLDDGRQVLVDQPSPVDQGVKLKLVMKDRGYEIYDPIGPWVGSFIALAIGIGLYLLGRKLTKLRLVARK